MSTTFEELAKAPIGDVSAGSPVFVNAASASEEAVATMAERDIGSVLVVDDRGKLIGIFTENDVCKRVDLGSQEWRKHSVSRYMTAPVKTVPKSMTVAAALRLMTNSRIRHLPVIDEAGQPIGVVSIRHVIGFIAGCFPKELINLPPEPGLEASEISGG